MLEPSRRWLFCPQSYVGAVQMFGVNSPANRRPSCLCKVRNNYAEIEFGRIGMQAETKSCLVFVVESCGKEGKCTRLEEQRRNNIE